MKQIYAIRDRIALDLAGNQMYALFLFRTDQQAVRYFADAILDTSSVLAKHPADYELIHCGAISDIGQLVMNEDTERGGPRIVITGDALMATQKPQLVQEVANA